MLRRALRMQGGGRLPLLAAPVFWATAMLAHPAAANGRFPAASQIIFSPSDPRVVVARTTFGLLVSHDDGASWQWVCESAIGLGNAQEDPYFGVTATGAIVGGLWQGLSVSADTGCNWGFVGGQLLGQRIVDLVVRRDAPDVILALTGTWLPDAGSSDGALSTSYYSQIFESSDDGVNFDLFGAAIDPSVIVSTIEVAPSDANRIYVTGTRGAGSERSAQLFVSDDSGGTWTERSAPLIPATESSIYIGAVDPANPDVVYLRTDGNSRLLVTTDGGKSFQVASFQMQDGGTTPALDGYMLGFALSPDGSKIYAGGADDGLFVGEKGSLSLVHVSGIHVQCLATRGSELWACSDDASGFVVGVSSDDGAAFAPRFRLDELDGVLACDAGATTAQCAMQYAAQCMVLDGCAGDDAGEGRSDAGLVDAGAGGAAVSAGEPRSGCGCSAVGRAEELVRISWLAVPALAIGWRRKRSRNAR